VVVVEKASVIRIILIKNFKVTGHFELIVVDEWIILNCTIQYMFFTQIKS